jgi:hypothetical protein
MTLGSRIARPDGMEDHHLFQSTSRSRRTASLVGFFDLNQTFDGHLR